MGTGAHFPITRVATDEIPVAERIAEVCAAYAGTIADVEIMPHATSEFAWRGTWRKLPGLALASAATSGVRITRAAASGGDDLIFTVAVEGRIMLQQAGRETVLRAGDIAVTRARQSAMFDCAPESHWIDLGVPSHALSSTIDDDAVLVAAIAAPEPRAMLVRYVDVLLASVGLERPETLSLAVAHVHEIVSLVLLAARGGGASDRARRPGAARLRAIKADIVEHASSRDLTVASVAARHRVTPRYVRKLFESEHTTFSEFVLQQRLARARRMLADPRAAGETISAIAFACGFGDLSYFNRVFRRHYGATPTAVRERTPEAGCGAAG
ncbi:MAG TPA: helix-turn-helix transcriptional regulator [Xanthobacteraceae bacterium]|nr:helix-turn-helix transcriptional regulator [Xanthobacteraceae bacterium]